MRAHVVADIGNSRIKWGLRARDESRILASVSLPDDPAAWEEQLALRQAEPPLSLVAGPLDWVLASVQPRRSDRFRDWLLERGHRVAQLERADQLPLRVDVPIPDHVGIDRLLDAVAALSVLPPGRGAVLVDAGSAVTVDWLDEDHVFRGGSIFPGLRVMAESLHHYTALLPRITVESPIPELPAKATIPAMQVGIFLAVSGGIREAVRRLAEGRPVPPRVIFTGGDSTLLMREMGLTAPAHLPSPWTDTLHWPNQTLEGILHSAETLP
jgi:type III pantothenate kinase